jgi:hypothetical protein
MVTLNDIDLNDIGLDGVTAIYYRRPGRFVFSPEIPDPYLSWCEGQARYGFWGVLESLPARWVNHPRAVASAEYKPRQLAWANACGLAIPPTLVSNDPDAIATFAESVGGEIVTKPLYARMPRDEHGRLMGLTYTAIVPPQRWRDESIRTTAHLFQQRVPNAWHIRLTVAGQHMFATEIHQPKGAHLDWRHDRDAVSDLRSCPVPDEIRRGVTALLQHVGLLYGALDFIVTPIGEWIFLELNPNRRTVVGRPHHLRQRRIHRSPGPHRQRRLPSHRDRPPRPLERSRTPSPTVASLGQTPPRTLRTHHQRGKPDNLARRNTRRANLALAQLDHPYPAGSGRARLTAGRVDQHRRRRRGVASVSGHHRRPGPAADRRAPTGRVGAVRRGPRRHARHARRAVGELTRGLLTICGRLAASLATPEQQARSARGELIPGAHVGVEREDLLLRYTTGGHESDGCTDP